MSLSCRMLNMRDAVKNFDILATSLRVFYIIILMLQQN